MHFEWEGKDLCLPLDIIEVPMLHMGEELVSVFADMLYQFSIQKKVSAVSINAYTTCAHLLVGTLQALGITCNNVSNNDMMVDTLVNEMLGFDG